MFRLSMRVFSPAAQVFQSRSSPNTKNRSISFKRLLVPRSPTRRVRVNNVEDEMVATLEVMRVYRGIDAERAAVLLPRRLTAAGVDNTLHDGRTFLGRASRRFWSEGVSLLLKAGADPNLRNPLKGLSPAGLALDAFLCLTEEDPGGARDRIPAFVRTCALLQDRGALLVLPPAYRVQAKFFTLHYGCAEALSEVFDGEVLNHLL
jgi:hypothetical protein